MIVNRQSISCREDEQQGMCSGQPLQLDGGYPSGYFETTGISSAYGKLQNLQTVQQEHKDRLQSRGKWLVFENPYEAIIDSDTYRLNDRLRAVYVHTADKSKGTD